MPADTLTDVWNRAVGVQAAPSDGVLAATAALAVVLVVVPALWRRCRNVVTIAHEASHAVVAVASGRKLAGIRLHADTSGLTLSRGRSGGVGMVLTAAAGYPGPGLLGLGAAWLVHNGRAVGLLWLALVVLVALLVWVRNLYGLWVVSLATAAVFAVSWWGSSTLQVTVACTLTWFLLLAAPRTVLEMQHQRRHGPPGARRTSDADVLGRLTHLPGLVWVAILLLLTIATLGAGALLLVGLAR